MAETSQGARLGALLETYLARIPGGVCREGCWMLLHATDSLRSLLEISGDEVPEQAFINWLAHGAREEVGEESQNGGTILFKHESGDSYLIHWWTARGEGDSPCFRLFTLQKIPLLQLNNAAWHAMRELDSILDSIHDGIWVIDGNGITRRINRAMERIAGIHSDEVVGRHVSVPLREGRFKTCVTLRSLQTKRTVTLFDDYSNGKRCLNTSTPVFDNDGNVWRVIAAIRDITELENLQKKLSNLEVEAMAFRLRAQGLENSSQGGLIGQSPLLQSILQDVTRAAHTDAVTLILGETGTGKSLAAKTIHDLSGRAEKPFVTVNCGAIAPSLMESELFGYDNGAFTGAARGGKPGMLELAAGGTLLLDEIGELSLPMQAKLLHVLDGEAVYRVGGTRPIKVEARIIAATNRQLDSMVAEGKFRKDLFYRLRVLCVDMPPLRERKEDILLLAWHFLQKINAEKGMNKRLDARAEQIFLAYAWPGNIRELQSVIQSLATLCYHDNITPADLPAYMLEAGNPGRCSSARQITLNDAVEKVEKEMIAEALAETGSTYKAARRLGVSQSSVARKARKYGLSGSGHETGATVPPESMNSAPADTLEDHPAGAGLEGRRF